MAFNFDVWKEQTARQLKGWKGRFQRSGTRSVYYFLAASSLLPVAQAVASGDWGALAVLGAALGSAVGSNLLANMLQQIKDRSESETATLLEREAEQSAELKVAIDALLARLDAVALAENALSRADKAWFEEMVKRELSHLPRGDTYQATLIGDGGIGQGGGIGLGKNATFIQGKVNGDVIAPGGTKVVHPDPRQTARAAEEDARHAYLKKLRSHCQVLPLPPLGGDEGTEEDISLDEVYIDLNTARPIEKKALEKIRAGKLVTLPPELPERPAGEFFRRDEERTLLPVLDAVRLNRRVVLLGDPGAGKSTFVSKLLGWQAAVLLGECPPLPGFEADLLPILIVLRELAVPLSRLLLSRLSGEEQKRALLEVVHGYLKRPTLTDALESGRVLLALDGLDEVPQDLRQVVRQTVAALIAEYRVERLLITSRIRSYTDAAVFENLPSFTLSPFDKEQIARFVRGWYHAQARLGRVRENDRDARIRDLTRAATSSDLLEIASNPMMLTSMAIIHQKEIGLPKERVRLYKLVVDVLLRRWQKYKLGEEHMAPSRPLLDFLKNEDRLLSVMEHLAYEAHRSGKGDKKYADLPRLQALQILERKEYLGDIGLAQEFLDYVDQRAGLLKGNGGDPERPPSYSFPHRTFQEYLAGCYLIRDRSAARQYRLHAAEGDFWMLAALLGAEELYYNRRSPHVMRDLAYELLPRTQPAALEEQRLALWSGLIACVAGKDEIEADEGGILRGRDYLEQARLALVHVLEGGLSPLERAEAGRVLSKLGDPRSEVLTCARMVFCHVPQGEFIFGEGKEQKKISLPEYWIGKYPVTNAQFAEFIAAGGYENPDYWREAQKEGYWSPAGFKGRWDDTPRKAPVNYGEPFNLGNHPVVGVSWYEALAFTRWLTRQLAENSEQLSVNREGARLREELRRGQLQVALPTDEQWEKAARGVDGREYPWKGGFDPNKANTGETGIDSTTAVGCFPGGVSPFGALDMSGNVWEWVAEPGPLRGGSFDLLADGARCACRRRVSPDDGNGPSGFRVVVSPFFSR